MQDASEDLGELYSQKAFQDVLQKELDDWTPPEAPGEVHEPSEEEVQTWSEFHALSQMGGAPLSHDERTKVFRLAKFVLDAPDDLYPPMPKRLVKEASELGDIKGQGLNGVPAWKARAFLEEVNTYTANIAKAKKFLGTLDDQLTYTDEQLKRVIAVKAQDQLIALAAREQATRQLNAQNYAGVRELGWDQLGNEVVWLVEPVITAAGTAFLVGKRNRGKTFVAIDLACNLILGRPWLGMETKPTRVLYVLGEGVAGFRARVEAWCSFNGAALSDVVKGLTVVDSANLSTDAALDQLREIANRDEVGLIIIDTYIANAGVESENDAALNQRVVNDAKTIRPEATVLFLHHPTKETADSACPVMRGSGALDGTVDAVLSLYKDVDYMKTPGVLGPRFAISTDADHGGKSREAEPVTLRGFSISSHAGSAVLVRDADADTTPTSPAAKRVSEYLLDGMTRDEYTAVVAEKTGTKKTTAFTDLKKFATPIPDTKPQKWKKG